MLFLQLFNEIQENILILEYTKDLLTLDFLCNVV